MKGKVFDELFEKLNKITGVKDIAYHEIRNGKLYPVYKTETDILGIKKWKEVHGQTPVYIEKTPVLKEITSKKIHIAIDDTKSNNLSASEFFFFGIDSILVIPVIKNSSVAGIVVIASIGKQHIFPESEINECRRLVSEYSSSIEEGKEYYTNIRLADAIMKYLELNSVEYIFGIPAGTVSPLYDAVNDVNIKPIIAKNEGGAAYMASRYASISKKLGVCLGAGGVGVNNMLNGIADAKRAKNPVLIISGHVHRWQKGKGAIQELDTEDIFKPVTKYSKTVFDEKSVMDELRTALQTALTPPQGPVHLSIPIDVQLSAFIGYLPDRIDYIFNSMINYTEINRAIEIINEEDHGIIMVGKGCRGLSKEIQELSEHLQWPIITTPEGKGVIHSEFPLNLGNYGFAGTDTATHYVEHGPAKCLLILGSSLGEASTYNFSKALINGKKVIHADWDEKELGKVYSTDVKIHCDLNAVVPKLIKGTKKSAFLFEKPELNKPYIRNHTGLSTRVFLESITSLLPQNTYYVCDLGEYMNFVFKYLQIPEGGDFEVNINYGAMGSGIAGSIGASLASPKRLIVVFAGDGSFFMNGSEILTAKEYGLPIIYIIFNNAMLGYVNRGHQFLYGRSLSEFKQQPVSISEMMKAAGIRSLRLKAIEDIDQLGGLTAEIDGPCLVEVSIDGSEPAPILDRLKSLSKIKN